MRPGKFAVPATNFYRLNRADDRNQHIQACLRREIASKRELLQSDVHYCHLCFKWVVGREEWESHCQTHLQRLTSKRCGTITYCHTLVRPGYCPFCLGSVSESAAQRLESWCRDHALWTHIDSHLVGRRWPCECPHPQCDRRLSGEKDMQYHFIDDHGLSRTRPNRQKSLATSLTSLPDEPRSKRKSGTDSANLSWTLLEDCSSFNPAKKRRRSPSTISPSLLSHPDDPVKRLPFHNDVALPSPAVTESAPPCHGEVNHWDRLSVDWKSPTETSSLDSTDSTLIDSPRWDDSLFSHFLRSPSPDGERTSQDDDDDDDDEQKNNCAPDSDVPPSSANVGMASWGDQTIDALPGGLNKVSIRLRVKPDPPPALPRTNIVLRCPARKRQQQRTQRRR